MSDRLETHDEYIRRMADDGTGNLASDSEVEQNLRDFTSLLGNVVGSPVDIPPDVDIRANGLFTSPDDLREYLERGGLISHDGTDYQPSPLVYILEEYDGDLGEWTFQVYIANDS